MYSRKFLIILVALLLTLPASTAPGQAKAPPKPAPGKHDPAVEAQLRMSFAKIDLDKNGFMDDTELAKAFRGPNAKAAPSVGFDEKGNLPPAASIKLPDQIYLVALDRDGDGRVSWAEFDAHGEAYAAQLKNLQQLNQQALRQAYAQAQRQLAVRRNVNYSRNNRGNYYRQPANYRGRTASFSANRTQNVQHMIQDQLLRMRAQRAQLNYSPNALRLHRQPMMYRGRR